MDNMVEISNDFFRCTRQDKSLGLLTKRFVSLLMNSPDGTVHLNTVSVFLFFFVFLYFLMIKLSWKTNVTCTASELVDFNYFSIILIMIVVNLYFCDSLGCSFAESRSEKTNLRYYKCA